MVFGLASRWVILSIFLSSGSVQAGVRCRYETAAEAQNALQLLRSKFSAATVTSGFFDRISSLEGCSRALKEQADTHIQSFEHVVGASTFPPDNDACIRLAIAHDKAQSWVFQYTQVRAPHTPGTPKTPEVCVTGKLQINYEAACKMPDPSQLVGLSAQNQDVLAQANASAEAINASAKKPSPKTATSALPARAKRLDRKELNARERALVMQSAEDFKKNNRVSLSPLASMGELFVHSELGDADPKDYPALGHSDYLENWQAQVAEYKRLYASTAGKPIEQRLEILYRAVNADFTRKYNSNDDASWNRPGTRMIEFLEGEGANCQAAAKLNLAVLASVVGDDLPQNLMPAVQVTKGHVETVLYDTKNKTVWATRSGGAPTSYEEGELYHPAILLRADLFSHRQDSVPENELLIARPANAPAQKQAPADARAHSGTPEQRALPASEYGVAAKTEYYSVVRFSGRDQTAGAPNANADQNDRVKLKSSLSTGRLDFLKADTAVSVMPWGRDWDFYAQDTSLDGTEAAYLQFNQQKDFDAYSKLTTIQQRHDFLTARARQRLHEANDYFENEGEQIILNPSKWNDKESILRVWRAARIYEFARVSLETLHDENLEKTVIQEATTRWRDVMAKTRELARERPEVMLRALDRSETTSVNLTYLWGRRVDYSDEKVAPVISNELINALNRLREVRVGYNGTDPLQAGDIDPAKNETEQTKADEPLASNGTILTAPTRTAPRVHRVIRKTNSNKAGGGFRFETMSALIKDATVKLNKPFKFSPLGLDELRAQLLSPEFYSAQAAMMAVRDYLDLLSQSDLDDLAVRKILTETCPRLPALSGTTEEIKHRFCAPKK